MKGNFIHGSRNSTLVRRFVLISYFQCLTTSYSCLCLGKSTGLTRRVYFNDKLNSESIESLHRMLVTRILHHTNISFAK